MLITYRPNPADCSNRDLGLFFQLYQTTTVTNIAGTDLQSLVVFL